jgi:O-antigen ligase/Tfp pilus assembly protein PilF
MKPAECSAARGWSERVLEGLWLVAAVFVPLAINPWGTNAFELPKVLLLRLLTILMGLAALGHVLGGRGRPAAPGSRPSMLVLGPALLFGLVLAGATVFSVDPRASLWGSYERQQGLLAAVAYLVLFLLTATGLRCREQVRRLLLALVWGSAPVVAYGLIQAAGLDPLPWRTDAASPVLATLGRSNFLASYLVLVIPLTAACWALARCRGRRHWPYLLLIAAQLACLALTQARAGWIGLGVAVLASLLAWALAVSDWRPALAAILLALCGIGFVFLLNVSQGPLSSLAQLPGLDRLAGLFDSGAGSTAARLTTWRATLPLIAERPWLGYGPETMRPVFARVFPPELVYYEGRHILVDRAHNLWLDVGISSGLAGIAAFAALAAGFGLVVWRGLRRSGSSEARTLWIALVAAVAGHLADLHFGFSLTGSTTVFWLVLAVAAALPKLEGLEQEAAGFPVRSMDRTALLYLLPPAVAGLILIGLVCVRPLLADVAYAQGGLVASQRAVRLWPLEPAYRLELARAWTQQGSRALAAEQLDAAVALSPGDPRIWAEQGEIDALWGEVDPGEFEGAERDYRRAIDLAPNVAAYHVALGLILARQGRLDEGLAQVERAVDLDATDFVAYRHLADLYQARGQEREASWARQQAERWERETAIP